jgi:hypothetical protein
MFSVARLELGDLPFRSLTWVTASSLIAVGYDYIPVLFTYDGATSVTRQGKIDVPVKKAAAAQTYVFLQIHSELYQPLLYPSSLLRHDCRVPFIYCYICLIS